MPAQYRLAGWVAGRDLDKFPLPSGYSSPSVLRYNEDPNFGVPYTIRNNGGRPITSLTPANLSWYNFLVP